jgi:hypothetical protein
VANVNHRFYLGPNFALSAASMRAVKNLKRALRKNEKLIHIGFVEFKNYSMGDRPFCLHRCLFLLPIGRKT